MFLFLHETKQKKPPYLWKYLQPAGNNTLYTLSVEAGNVSEAPVALLLSTPVAPTALAFSTAPVKVTFPPKVSTLIEAPLMILSLKTFAFTSVVTK